MSTRLKYLFLGLLFVMLGSGVLGCESGYHHGWYGDPYYSAGWGRSKTASWGAYEPYAYRDSYEGQHRHHEHDDD
jgi:hypothetical protein